MHAMKVFAPLLLLQLAAGLRPLPHCTPLLDAPGCTRCCTTTPGEPWQPERCQVDCDATCAAGERKQDGCNDCVCFKGRFLCFDAGRCTTPPPAQVCTQEVMECADGSHVGRDPARACAFRPCPTAATPTPTLPPPPLREGDVCKSGGVTTGLGVDRELDCPAGTECVEEDVLSIGGEGTSYCRASKGCCYALTAECLACAADQTEEAYCAAHPDTIGCPETPVPAKCIRALPEWSGCLATPECCEAGLYCKAESQWWASCRKMGH